MNYLHFKFKPDKHLQLTLNKLLELRDCKIYVSKNLYLELLHYFYELMDQKFLCTGILKFPKMNKIIIKSDRVRDGIFYVGRN